MDVTVVIPLFNKESTIERCLRSVARQVYPPKLVIVVNDGSDDRGPEIVQSFEGLNVRLVNQVNRGVSAARNVGVQLASSDWVAFLDADDEYLPDALLVFAEAHRSHAEADVIFGRSAVGASPEHGCQMEGSCVAELLPNYFVFLIRGGVEMNSSSVVARRSILEQAGPFPDGVKIGEDTDMWMRLGLFAEVAFAWRNVSVYHIEDGASNWSSSLHDIPHWYSTLESLARRPDLRRDRLSAALRWREHDRLSRAVALAAGGDVKAARRLVFSAWSWSAVPPGRLVDSLLWAYLTRWRLIMSCLKRRWV